MTYSVDTNVLLRFLVKDDSRKAQQVNRLIQAARGGKKNLLIETAVIIEIAYVLDRYYKLSKGQVCEKLRSVLALSFVEIPDRDELSEATEVYATHGVDFIDALLFIRALRNGRQLLSYDSGFDKLTPKLRHEP